MSENDKDKDNPFEELQKQIQNMLSNPRMRIQGIHPGMTAPPQQESEKKDEQSKEKLNKIRNFRLKPKDVFSHLNRYVIGQNEAKKVLSVAVCDHYNNIREQLDSKQKVDLEYQKQNVLLLGPTGVGKTYLMKNLARLIGVPFVKADATKFSETGYIGADVEDLVRDLVKNAEGDVDLAEMGIIYIDEIDKIASETSNGAKDVSGRGVQINLLKLMEETEVSPFSQTDMMGQMQAMMSGGGGKSKRLINTKNILFIVSGAFDQLARSIQKRVGRSGIGFASEVPDTDDEIYRYLPLASTTDFIQYGFEPEFVGRLPIRVAFDALSSTDLAKILKTSEGSVLRQYIRDFKSHGINLVVVDEAIDEIASKAHAEHTGARGVMSVMERLFRDFKFELPSTSISELKVDANFVLHPENILSELREKYKDVGKAISWIEFEKFADSFQREHSIGITFNEEAANYLTERAEAEEKSIGDFCAKHFEDLPYGLKIVARNSHQTEFTIDKDCAVNPDREISNWVVKSFREQKESPKDSGETSD